MNQLITAYAYGKSAKAESNSGTEMVDPRIYVDGPAKAADAASKVFDDPRLGIHDGPAILPIANSIERLKSLSLDSSQTLTGDLNKLAAERIALEAQQAEAFRQLKQAEMLTPGDVQTITQKKAALSKVESDLTFNHYLTVNSPQAPGMEADKPPLHVDNSVGGNK